MEIAVSRSPFRAEIVNLHSGIQVYAVAIDVAEPLHLIQICIRVVAFHIARRFDGYGRVRRESPMPESFADGGVDHCLHRRAPVAKLGVAMEIVVVGF